MAPTADQKNSVNLREATKIFSRPEDLSPERHTADTPPKKVKNPNKVAAGRASAAKTQQNRAVQKEKAKKWDDYQASLSKNTESSSPATESPVAGEAQAQKYWTPSFNQVISVLSLGVSAGVFHFKVRPWLASRYGEKPTINASVDDSKIPVKNETQKHGAPDVPKFSNKK